MKRSAKLLACFVSLALAAVSLTPAYAAEEADISKDENVFVILNPDGSVKEQIVSNWLHSGSALADVEDVSSLTDIENLKGQLAPERQGSSLRWNTEETDVYYQGRTEQTPPVTAAVTYELDGQAAECQELTGRSGHLKITIALTNHEKASHTVNGQPREIYTPFFTVIAADLPAEHFSNVKAEKGTVQTDGSNQLVCFLAMPGMRANFEGLLTGELDGLKEMMVDTVTLEADVKDFTMPAIMMAAATSMEELTDVDDSFSGLEGSLDELKDATGALQDGAKALSEAVSLLKEKLEQLEESYSAFDEGIASALAGAKALQQGASQLEDGVKGLADGTQQLKDGSGELARKLNEQLVPGLAEAAGQQQSLMDKMVAIQTALGNMSLPDMGALKEQLASGVGAVFDKAAEGAAQGAAGAAISGYHQTLEAVLAGSGLDAAAQADILSAVNAALSQNGVTAEQIAGGVTAQMDGAKQQAVAQTLKALEGLDLSSLEALIGQFDVLSGDAQRMLGSVAALTGALYNEDNPADAQTVVGAASAIAAGAEQVNTGVDALNKGADSLAGGTKELVTGLTAARSASTVIKGAIGQFLEGADSLQEGAGSLRSGMDSYAQEGIGQLVDSVEALKLGETGEVLAAIRQQADGYHSYTGAPEGVKAQVKFVMKLQAPASQEEAGQPEEENTAQAPVSFWDRVKNLFS